VTALALIHQHAHTHRPVIHKYGIGRSLPGSLARLEVGPNLLIKGTAQAIKRIHAGNGLDHPGPAPHTKFVGSAVNMRLALFRGFYGLPCHNGLLGFGVSQIVMRIAFHPDKEHNTGQPAPGNLFFH
jgi:hypothetical protein